jgi:hypothetical protein
MTRGFALQQLVTQLGSIPRTNQARAHAVVGGTADEL